MLTNQRDTSSNMRTNSQTQIAKKKRTRAHVISDLSANFVELRALECGYSTERIYHDYGIDMNLYTYNENGEIENGFVPIQLKATDHPDYTVDKKQICFPVKKADLRHWLREIYPVIFIVYDANIRKAYWVYVQNYFGMIVGFNVDKIGETHKIRIDTRQIVTRKAIKRIARFKELVLAKSEGVVTHV